MEILLSSEAENKYYSGELSNMDIRKELLNNGFTAITGEDNKIIEFQFKDKVLKNARLRQHNNFDVYLEIKFEQILTTSENDKEI